MPKNSKSSATSATRKKHLKKSADPSPPAQPKLTKQQRAQKKKEPKVKVYVPPVKPTAVQPDPLETTGLAHRLPPELVVVLRSLGKKALVTKVRALEELKGGWVDRCDEEGVYVLVDMLPVWIHHIPALFIHPSRRIRFLSATIHLSFIQLPAIREAFLSFLLDSDTDPAQISRILGTWYISAHDVDKSIGGIALKSWVDVVSFTPSPNQFILDDLSSLLTFLQQTILDPNEVYTSLNPTIGTETPRDEQEENETDRNARLRIGSLGAVRRIIESLHTLPPSLRTLLTNPSLWSALSPLPQPPFAPAIQSFGHAQPNLRKSAWGLLLALLSLEKAEMEPLVPMLSTVVLRSAWVESESGVQGVMWQPLLRFIKEYPNAWDIERSASDSESTAYLEFLHFLSIGCSNSPLTGYPTILIILSTVPSSILTPSTLFPSFWSALSSRALTGPSQTPTHTAFLSSLLESLVFVVRRLSSLSTASPTDPSTAPELIQTQLGDVWRRITNGELKVEYTDAARMIVKTLEDVRRVDLSLFHHAWDTLSTTLLTTSRTHPAWVSTFLKASYDRFHEGQEGDMVRQCVWDVCSASVDQITNGGGSGEEAAGGKSEREFIVHMIQRFREGLFEGSVGEKLDTLLLSPIPTLLSTPTLLLTYLTHRNSPPHTTRVWRAFLRSCSSSSLSSSAIKPLLDAIEVGGVVLPPHLTPDPEGESEFDAVVRREVGMVLDGDEDEQGMQVQVLKRVLELGDHFLTSTGYLSTMRTIVSAFSREVGVVLASPTPPSPSSNSPVPVPAPAPTPAHALTHALTLLTTLLHPPRTIPAFEPSPALLSDLVVVGYLLPVAHANAHVDNETATAMAMELWVRFLPTSEEGEVKKEVCRRLSGMLVSTGVWVEPRDVNEMIQRDIPGIRITPGDILPASSVLDGLLEKIEGGVHESVGVLGFVPAAPTTTRLTNDNAPTYDTHGYSPYARLTTFLLTLFTTSRPLLRDPRHLWALRHLLALGIFAGDCVAVPYAAGAGVFKQGTVGRAELEGVVRGVERVVRYVFMGEGVAEGRERALRVLVGEEGGQRRGEGLAGFLVRTIRRACEGGSMDTRILQEVLRYVCRDVNVDMDMGKDEAERWVRFARGVEARSPETSMVITHAITQTALEPPLLTTHRASLASSLLPSLLPSQALLTLRKLLVCAPDPNSDVVFLSQQRAVNLMRACQGLLASDDGEGEGEGDEVVSAMTGVFYYLAPVLQDLMGGHWELMFDVVESNLEETSLADDTTLITLARTLRLVILIQDLTMTNKALRTVWEERRMGVLGMVRDLAGIKLDDLKPSVPRSTCRELLLSIVQDLPTELIDQGTFSKMCHLVTDPSVEVQKMAYHFLALAAKKRTEYLVIEAGVDSEGSVDVVLPEDLLGHLCREDESSRSNVFGYLLAWMLLFDLFYESSLKVRSSYIEELRNLDVVVAYFIPTILSLLRLDQGPYKAFKLDIWAVDEFRVEYYEPAGSAFSLPVLAAHLYYRALLTVPSLIHTWVTDCKDRQLSTSITNYTSQCFSPVIIQTELAHVKSAESMSTLVDESFAVKVASSVNEVVASYSVDEHQLEIKLRIPADWPLHKIEIRDVKRVGVDENRWRAWILAVQQIIWSHNGRIVDGLGLFKKNVTLHFEGQVECAICYSIISVMDATLPRKPCRTCKNRFHAGCLYKWFNTSHSSSCPLCRSDIF